MSVAHYHGLCHPRRGSLFFYMGTGGCARKAGLPPAIVLSPPAGGFIPPCAAHLINSVHPQQLGEAIKSACNVSDLITARFKDSKCGNFNAFANFHHLRQWGSVHDEKKSRVLRHPPAACRVKARRIPSPGWGERTLAGGKLASASAAPGCHKKSRSPEGVTEA